LVMEDCVLAKSVWSSFTLVLVTAILATGVGTLPLIDAQARLGAAYSARVVCSCHYVSQRPLEACKADLPVSAQSVILQADKGQGQVHATMARLYTRSARFTPGYGCVLLPE
jgi:hypothetical protein